MVPMPSEPRNHGSFSKSKQQAKQAEKKVMLETNRFQAKELPLTAEPYVSRREINEVLSFYRKLVKDRELLHKLLEEHGLKGLHGWQHSGLTLHIKAARLLECLGRWVNECKQTGHVSGIQVGDSFHWRCELSTVGLHRDFRKGIDCMKLINGKTVAISIVDSGRYENARHRGLTLGTLMYNGEGGNPKLGGGSKSKPKDQKLIGGNLALKNNIDEDMPVRVILRYNNIGERNNACGYKFVYAGLYRVIRFWKEKGVYGTYVYKFLLQRIKGQPELDIREQKRSDLKIDRNKML